MWETRRLELSNKTVTRLAQRNCASVSGTLNRRQPWALSSHVVSDYCLPTHSRQVILALIHFHLTYVSTDASQRHSRISIASSVVKRIEEKESVLPGAMIDDTGREDRVHLYPWNINVDRGCTHQQRSRAGTLYHCSWLTRRRSPWAFVYQKKRLARPTLPLGPFLFFELPLGPFSVKMDIGLF